MTNWQLTRTDTNDTVELPQDMQWVDEFGWSSVVQTEPAYSLSGSLLVQQGKRLAGRPITLSGEWVWHKRQTVETLMRWAEEINLPLELTHYDGRRFTVAFRLHDTALGEVSAVQYATPENENERYVLTVNLMTV